MVDVEQPAQVLDPADDGDSGFKYSPTGGDDAYESPFRNGFAAYSLEPPEGYKTNPCRDLVLLDGGISLRIQALRDAFPSICWQYKPIEGMLSHELSVFRPNQTAPICNTSTVYHLKGDQSRNAGFFYGFICSPLSPWEFYIQPKAFEPFLRNMEEQMQLYYYPDTVALTENQIYVGVPCVVNVNRIVPSDGQQDQEPQWRRAKVVQYRAEVHTVQIILVDWGRLMFVHDMNEMKPLHAQFAKLPPLAFMCRLKGISINDLNANKLDEWQRTVREIKFMCRIRLRSNTQPFHVDARHPLLLKTDLAINFLPHPVQERSPVSKLNSDYEDSDEEEEPEQPPYIVRCERPSRPPKFRFGPTLTVTHIASAHAIFVQDDYLKKAACEMTNQLTSYMNTNAKDIPCIPHRMLKVFPELACAVFQKKTQMWIRAVILGLSADESQVYIQAIDYGYTLAINNDQTFPLNVKALPSQHQFRKNSMVWQVKLDGACDRYADMTSTSILRRLMPVGCRVTVTFLKRASPPYRATLVKDDCDVGESLQAEIDYNCLWPSNELVPYNADDKLMRLRVYTAPYIGPADVFFITKHRQISDTHMKGRVQCGYVNE